jgi:hypothetical protein
MSQLTKVDLGSFTLCNGLSLEHAGVLSLVIEGFRHIQGASRNPFCTRIVILFGQLYIADLLQGKCEANQDQFSPADQS